MANFILSALVYLANNRIWLHQAFFISELTREKLMQELFWLKALYANAFGKREVWKWQKCELFKMHESERTRDFYLFSKALGSKAARSEAFLSPFDERDGAIKRSLSVDKKRL